MKYKNNILIILTAILLNCASTVPEPKFMPKVSDSVFPFFSAGQPIAAIQAPNSFMLLSLDQTILTSRTYLRLWILYQNNSSEPYLLDPKNFITLDVISLAKSKYGTSMPESPTKILADISNKKAEMMILQAIGGTLRSISTKPTSSETKFSDGSSAKTTFNDQQEKRDIVNSQTASAMSNASTWYDIYQNSISDGILRRNTIFPGKSINGYIYFPIPTPKEIPDQFQFDPKLTQELAGTRYYFKAILKLPEKAIEVIFTPIAGE